MDCISFTFFTIEDNVKRSQAGLLASGSSYLVTPSHLMVIRQWYCDFRSRLQRRVRSLSHLVMKYRFPFNSHICGRITCNRFLLKKSYYNYERCDFTLYGTNLSSGLFLLGTRATSMFLIFSLILHHKKYTIPPYVCLRFKLLGNFPGKGGCGSHEIKKKRPSVFSSYGYSSHYYGIRLRNV